MAAVLASAATGLVAFPVLVAGSSWPVALGFTVLMQLTAFFGVVLIATLRVVDEREAETADTTLRVTQTGHRRSAASVRRSRRVSSASLSIGFAGAANIQNLETVGMLRELGHVVDWHSDISGLKHQLKTGQSRPDLAMIDLDTGANIVVQVDHLIYFRIKNPLVPVVLLTADVSADDFSKQRVAIGDVTLRTPATRDRLTSAVLIAMDQSRRRARVACGSA